MAGALLHSVKASPLVRLKVPPAAGRKAALLAPARKFFIDSLLEHLYVDVRLGMSGDAGDAIANALLAALKPPLAPPQLDVAPSLTVSRGTDGAASLASSVPSHHSHGRHKNEFANSLEPNKMLPACRHTGKDLYERQMIRLREGTGSRPR